MRSKPDPASSSENASVVIASFASSHHAEHMLASLGRGFRANARKGDGTTAVVVSGNADGSLRVRQSRVLTASGFAAALSRASVAWMIGFMGLVSSLKGAKGVVHAGQVREGRVASDKHRIHEILAEAGPRAAIALVRCEDRDTRQMVVAATADSANRSWDGSLTEFLAGLDPGRAHDWVRAALGEPSDSNR